jgi:crossover junction endodeoxyribonuclease RuvC
LCDARSAPARPIDLVPLRQDVTLMRMSQPSPSAAPPAPAPAGRILGIDPGLQVTGYAVLEGRPRGPHVCEAGIIRTAAGRKTTDVALRVRCLYDGIVEVLDQFRPEVTVVEQLFAHYEHPRTAILMGHARGVLLLAAAQRDVPVLNYAASRIKKTITGHGRASKEQMQLTMQRELNLPRLPEPNDVADALAVALCHYYVRNRP